MKEFYAIIIAKLNQDKINIKKEINEIVDEVETNTYIKDRYHLLKGKEWYCNELIEFFEEASKYNN